MAKLGNETKLVLKLARERAGKEATLLRGIEPRGFQEDPKLHEAFVKGFICGETSYSNILDLIVTELEEGRG